MLIKPMRMQAITSFIVYLRYVVDLYVTNFKLGQLGGFEIIRIRRCVRNCNLVCRYRNSSGHWLVFKFYSAPLYIVIIILFQEYSASQQARIGAQPVRDLRKRTGLQVSTRMYLEQGNRTRPEHLSVGGAENGQTAQGDGGGWNQSKVVYLEED